jgi:hypothetical protein
MAYAAFFHGQVMIAGATTLWKARATGKCRFFLWLVLLCYCWTSERFQRHGLDNDGPCTLCEQCEERIDHLLLRCPYSRQVWFSSLSRFGWQQSTPLREDTFVDWWLRARKGVAKTCHKDFNSLVILVAWSLWLQRNDRVFNRASLSEGLLSSSILANLD